MIFYPYESNNKYVTFVLSVLVIGYDINKN